MGQKPRVPNSSSPRPSSAESCKVKEVVQKIKNGKAAGGFWITADMLKGSGNVGVRMVTDLINAIIKEDTAQDNWQKHDTKSVNVY